MSRTKGLLFVCSVLSFLAFSVVLIRQSWPQLIPWEKDYHQALRKAQEENKTIVAYLFTDWCTYCQQMERETFSDVSLVKKMGKEYIWLKLNAETNQDGQRLQKESVPSTGVVPLVWDSPQLEVISRIAAAILPALFACFSVLAEGDLGEHHES